MPDLDANANAIAIEHIKLENEAGRKTLIPQSQRSNPSREINA